MADPPPYPGTPGWVKTSGIGLGVLIVLLVVVRLSGVGGPHGPGRHMPFGDVDGATLLSTEDPTPSGAGLAGD